MTEDVTPMGLDAPPPPPPPRRSGGKLIPLLLLLIIAGGGFWAWTQIESSKAALTELEAKTTQLTQENETLKQQAAACEDSKAQAAGELKELQKVNCKGVWTEEGGCEEPKQVFLAPTGGEELCFGKTVDVKWNAELVKSESVEIFLATSGNSAKLAKVPTAEGVYHWKLEPTHKTVGDRGSFTIAAGLYKLRMQNESGALLGKDTDSIEIKKCGGKTAAAPKKTLPPSKKKKK